MGSYDVSIACAIAAMLCIAYAGIMKKDFFHPTLFYVFCQCVTLGISYLKITPSMTDFKIVTWYAWLGAIAAFFLGTFAYYMVCPGENKLDKEKIKEAGEAYNWHLHVVICLVLSVLFVVGAVMVARSMGGFYLFNIGEELNASKNASTFANVSYASSPFVATMWFLGAFKSINPYRRVRCFSLWAGIGIIVLSMCVYPGRSTLFLSLGAAFIMFNYLKARIPVKLIVIVLAVAISSFVAVGLIRAQYGTSSLEGMSMDYVMELPYKYIANNYWNLDYALNPPNDRERHPFTYGLDLVGVPIEYTMAPGGLRQSNGWDDFLNARIMKEQGYNTVSYLWDLYKNFGMAGCIFVPFLMAFFFSYFYEKMKVYCNPQLFVFMAISIYQLGWNFFYASFKFGHVWLWLYIILFMHYLCKKKLRADKSPELAQN